MSTDPTGRPSPATTEAVKDMSKDIRDAAALDAKGPLAGEAEKDRLAREAKETLEPGVLNDLGRIEEVRGTLARVYENYRGQVDQALKRLNGYVGGSAHPEVQKTAKAVADAYDLKLNPGGLKQPVLPKGAKSPFEEK